MNTEEIVYVTNQELKDITKIIINEITPQVISDTISKKNRIKLKNKLLDKINKALIHILTI